MALYKGFSSIDYKLGFKTTGSFAAKQLDGTKKIAPIIDTFMDKENDGNNTFVLTDIKLVERNILNHIFTRKGERIMMPKFGTNIPYLVFEPLDQETIDQCRSELEAVVAYDPRVSLNSIDVNADYDHNALTVTLSLFYIELNVTKNMNFNIEFVS
jgi:phage baseplate assembly protein W